MIGERCENAGVSLDVWEKCLAGVVTEPCVNVSYGCVLELYAWCNRNSHGLKDFLTGLACLTKNEKLACVNVGTMQREMRRCMDEKAKLKKSAGRDSGKMLDLFLNGSFVVPGCVLMKGVSPGISKENVSESVREKGCDGCMMSKRVIEDKESEIARVTECLNEVSQLKDELEKKLVALEQREKESERKVIEARSVDVRNVNRRIRRMKEKLHDREVLIEEQSESMECMKYELEMKDQMLYDHEGEVVDACVIVKEQSDKIHRLKERYERARKSLWYRSKKETVVNDTLKARVKGLNDRVKALEHENVQLKERMNEFVESDEIKCFVGGRYTNDIRRVYQELIGLGVSASKIESIVRSVLEGLGKKVDRLPGETVAKRMTYECRALAWMQLSEEIERCENVTLQSDGTTKYGRHYGAFDLSVSGGRVYTLGMRDMAAGDSASTLGLLKEVLGDVAGMKGGDISASVQRMFASMKNTMSDRAASEKKFNELLHDYRASILPNVVSDWNELEGNEREKLMRMNNFFCGMHFVVGLAEQAEASLKVWEELVFGDECVGASALGGGKNWKNESGTMRLVRTVCKAVQDRGCEKSGKPVVFREFLRMNFGMNVVPLAPFKGNRFNIAFHNGAGVYSLYPQLCEFFDEVKDENKLMKAVNADLNVKQYVAGVRALGLIDKLVTVPLWKVTERREHVQGMSARYDGMLEKFVKWSQDASDVLRGNDCVFGDVDVHRDWVFDSLVRECDLDGMTKQILEVLFASFVKKTRMLLCDQLAGGVNADMDVDRMSETESVPKTNVGPERDFGMLDSLMRARPSAYTCAMEGVIMYKRNMTGEWMSQLGDERLNEVLENARKGVEQQRKDYLRRKAVIGAKRAESLKAKQDSKDRKEMKERVRAEDLSSEIGKYGGLWLTEMQVEERLSTMGCQDERKRAVESQLKFRKFVLKQKNVHGCLNVTSGGARLEYGRMLENLKVVVRGSCDERELVNVVDVKMDMRSAPVELVNELKEEYVQEKEREEGTERKRKHVCVSDRVPVINSLYDYVGKRVQYLSERNMWLGATVLGMKVVGGVERRCVHSVRLDGCNDVVEVDWMDDIRNGAVRLVPLCVSDLVGKRVEHLCKDEASGSEAWWKASVIECVNERKHNPEFILKYDDVGDSEEEDDEEEEELYGFPLYDDYVNGDLRLL